MLEVNDKRVKVKSHKVLEPRDIWVSCKSVALQFFRFELIAKLFLRHDIITYLYNVMVLPGSYKEKLSIFELLSGVAVPENGKIN